MINPAIPPAVQRALAGMRPGGNSRMFASAMGAPVPALPPQPAVPPGDLLRGGVPNAPQLGGMFAAKPVQAAGGAISEGTSAAPQVDVSALLGSLNQSGGMFAPQPVQLPDYMGGIKDAVFQNAMTAKPEKKKLSIAEILVHGLNGYLAGVGNPVGAANINAWNQSLAEQRREAFDREKWAAELEAERQKRLQPKVEQVGNTLGMFDPASLSYNPIFTAPQPFEIYARSLGLEPGTPEYVDAIRDYRAGTWGDEGVAGRLTVQEPRLAVTRRGQDMTDARVRRGQDLTDSRGRRGQDVSRDNNIRSTSTSRDNNIRSNQTRLQTSGGRRRTNEAVAVGPNGQTIVVRNGRWVDANTGRPIQ